MIGKRNANGSRNANGNGNHNAQAGGSGNGNDSGWNVVGGDPGDGVVGCVVSDDDLGWPRRPGGRDERRREGRAGWSGPEEPGRLGWLRLPGLRGQPGQPERPAPGSRCCSAYGTTGPGRRGPCGRRWRPRCPEWC
ncbi:hypothetical protein SGLAM104S_06535 [Streptomyces glaucescens]